MAILEVVLHPDNVLRQKAEPVKEITEDVLRLLDNMVETMYAEEGIGLAAPQVGVSKRVIVIDVEQKEDGTGNPIKMINPEIIEKSTNMTMLNEGCLSLPKMQVDVTRPDEVTVQYMDIEGNTQKIHGTELLAKALQHEIDHLNGVLIFDYLSSMKRDMALRKYNKTLRMIQE